MNKHAFGLSLVLGLVLAVPASADRQHDWQAVLDAQARAENAPTETIRQERYAEAYGRLRDWLRRYDQIGDADYCRHTARLALYAIHFRLDWAEQLSAILKKSSKCGSVRWNGRSLAVILDGALQGARRDAGETYRYVPHPHDPERDTGTIRVRYEHGKGGITVYADAPGLPEDPRYTPEEELEIATRRVPIGQAKAAVDIGRHLLSDAGIPFGVSAGDDLVVFGAFADRQRTERFARLLRANIRGLRDRYFPAGGRHAVLTVYANISAGGEAYGKRLSEAVHSRSRAGLEAYYEPLDHSMVLRKGLFDSPDRFYMGTPNHELVHALMADDYPAAPRWLDEGLAALHEETTGSLDPIDNYRLFYLKAALDHQGMPSLADLLRSDPAFISGPEYRLYDAMSRYLAIYLYEQGALAPTYGHLRDRSTPGDPFQRSAQALLVTTRAPDLDHLEEQFVQWLRARDP